MREAMLHLRDRFMDSLVGQLCPRCEAQASWSQARTWPTVRDTLGHQYHVCPRCYAEIYRPFSEQ